MNNRHNSPLWIWEMDLQELVQQKFIEQEISRFGGAEELDVASRQKY